MAGSLPEPTSLHGEGLTLRPWQEQDLDALAPIVTDPEISTWNPFPADLSGWLNRRSVWDNHTSWAVVDRTGALLGSVSMYEFDAGNRSCHLGYWTTPTARGRGIAPLAVKIATEFAFTALAIERIAIFHAVENLASCRVAEKAGFRLEGTTRKSWRYADGELHDEHLHSRLRTDQ